MNKILPKHMNQTLRQFKKQKRKEFRAIRQASRKLNFASAYLPREAFRKFSKAEKLIEDAYEICKPWWKKA